MNWEISVSNLRSFCRAATFASCVKEAVSEGGSSTSLAWCLLFWKVPTFGRRCSVDRRTQVSTAVTPRASTQPRNGADTSYSHYPVSRQRRMEHTLTCLSTHRAQRRQPVGLGFRGVGFHVLELRRGGIGSRVNDG